MQSKKTLRALISVVLILFEFCLTSCLFIVAFLSSVRLVIDLEDLERTQADWFKIGIFRFLVWLAIGTVYGIILSNLNSSAARRLFGESKNWCPKAGLLFGLALIIGSLIGVTIGRPIFGCFSFPMP